MDAIAITGEQSNVYTLQFDGLYRGFPGDEENSAQAGFLCYGWIILHNEQIIARGHGVYARGHNASSNIAEYLALIEGLDALTDLGLTNQPIHVIGDAKCVIDQMRGLASVSSANIRPLYRRAERLSQGFLCLTWEWRPRRHNRLADSLTRKALQQLRMDLHRYQAIAQTVRPADRRRSNSRFLPVLDLRVFHQARPLPAIPAA